MSLTCGVTEELYEPHSELACQTMIIPSPRGDIEPHFLAGI